MSGRSRWWGWLSSIVCFATAVGCSQLPLPPYGDAGIGDAAPPMTFGPRALTPVQVDAVALAADDSGIYWTSAANKLWVLTSDVPIPLPLAADSGAAIPCEGPTEPVLSTSYVFWMGAARATVHRTRKDGRTDDALAVIDQGDNLATDGRNVYWTERSSVDHGQGSALRCLPQNAASGSPPTTLLDLADQISSLALLESAAYWTPFPNATVYYADIWSGTVASLAGGAAGVKLPGLHSPYGVTTIGGALYFAFFEDLWTTGLGRLGGGDTAEQAIVTLPTDEYVEGLAIAGGWLLASTFPDGRACGEEPALHLYATPLAGRTPKLIAVGMRTPAIAAPQGIVFVDADRHLVALPADQIDGIVSPVP